MDNLPIGELAALGAAFSFSITSICYTFAGRKISAISAMALSLPISWCVIVLIHYLMFGEFVPLSASLDRWFNLSISGILAFVFSAYFMLNAYQYIGPRLTMLLMSVTPVLGAILAWIFLGQRLPTNSSIGIMIVIVGIVSVVIERNTEKEKVVQRDMRRGLLFAYLATMAQASSFIFSTQGISDGFPPFSATLIRLTAGLVTLWIFIAFQGKIHSTLSLFQGDVQLVAQLTAAAISGHVIAGSLLLLAFQFITVGVATTLAHTTAIMLIPLSYLIFKEKISLQAVIGTIVTIVGIAILFS